LISRSGIHAIRALTCLASLEDGAYAGSANIAGRIGAPANYLGKLLQTLTRRGIVESRKGTGGGFRLARAPERITLLDAIDPIDPLARWEGCFLGPGGCSDDNPCAVHREWILLRERYLKLLSKTSIADVVRRPPRLPSDLPGHQG
jgi:Rrf2 family protein